MCIGSFIEAITSLLWPSIAILSRAFFQEDSPSKYQSISVPLAILPAHIAQRTHLFHQR
jgi:hypothetical protein